MVAMAQLRELFYQNSKWAMSKGELASQRGHDHGVMAMTVIALLMPNPQLWRLSTPKIAQSQPLAISALTEPSRQKSRRKKGFWARSSQLEITNR